MSTRALVLAAVTAAGLACSPASKPVASVASSAAPTPVPRPPPTPPAWTYWESLDAGVDVRTSAPALPVSESSITFEGEARARWWALSKEAKRAVLERGFVVVPRAAPSARVGEAYAALRDARVPYLVTMDALFWLAHVARDRALASVEDRLLAPAVEALLRRLDLRLGADGRKAPGDLAAAYVVAQSVVAVGRALLSPAYVPPPEIARGVAEEMRRIEAHAGPARSAILGVTVDYSQIVPRGAAGESAARVSLARTLEWLASAPLALAGRGEVAGGEAYVGAARAQTRAALILARALEFEVDAEAAHAWQRLARVAAFVGGAADDMTPRDLAELAASSGLDPRDPAALVDTAKIDRFRHTLATYRAPRLDDGNARRVASVRLLPSRDAADAELVQALVFPRVGELDKKVDPPPSTARDGVRALPRALDVAAWLGSDDARAILHERHDDAYVGYDATMRRLIERRLPEHERHGSAYASSLDAIAAYLAPSVADAVQPGADFGPWRQRKIEAALAAWTTLRHDALAFARFPLASSAPPDLAGPRVADGVPAFVEPHPEAIAKLVALVRQVARGLHAVAASLKDGAPLPLLDDVDRLLTEALAIARREASDEPLDAEAREALATFPARLQGLERALGASHADEVSLAVDVHTDAPTGRALVEGCGDLDDLYALVREPRTGRLVLAVGVASSHFELTVPARDRPGDTAWRARLHAPDAPPRDGLTTSYRVTD